MARIVEYSKHRQAGGKYLMVQRQFKELQWNRLTPGLLALVPTSRRIYRSSGTNDGKTFDRINDMLTRLAIASGQNDDALILLAKLSIGQVSFLDALRDFDAKGFSGIRKYGEEDGPIDEAAFDTWIAGHQIEESTRRTYKANYRTMMKFANSSETMKDLPEILTRYKAYAVRKKKNFRAWNYSLVVMEAWVKGTLGKRSDVYGRLTELDRFTIKKHHRFNQYFSPAQIRAVCDAMPFDVGKQCWMMAIFGMGPKELMEDGFAVEGQGLHIFGAKTEHRDRLVPLVEQPAPVTVTVDKTLRQWVKRASKGTMKPYDFRRSYPRWLLDAGVAYHRVKMYQGHAPQTQTDEYAFHDVQRFLAEDGATFRAWLDKELSKKAPDAA
jgi:hypothetical protein